MSLHCSKPSNGFRYHSPYSGPAWVSHSLSFHCFPNSLSPSLTGLLPVISQACSALRPQQAHWQPEVFPNSLTANFLTSFRMRSKWYLINEAFPKYPT